MAQNGPKMAIFDHFGPILGATKSQNFKFRFRGGPIGVPEGTSGLQTVRACQKFVIDHFLQVWLCFSTSLIVKFRPRNSKGPNYPKTSPPPKKPLPNNPILTYIESPFLRQNYGYGRQKWRF